MKVCTDASIFGAWISKKISEEKLLVKRCLDIGTGTGLLSLMLSQKNKIDIDAVEINEDAYEQAEENFKSSLWNDQIKPILNDVKKMDASKKYDLVICNPPFYLKHLKSSSLSKNLAKHNDELDLKTLISIIDNHLNVDGYFSVLLSYHQLTYFEKLAEQYNFFIENKILIRQTPAHKHFRAILFYTRKIVTPRELEIIIKNKEDKYSAEFIELLKDFYLKL